MDDAELRGLLEQIQERVDRAMEMTEEVGRQIADHRLTVAGVVGDLKLNLSQLSGSVAVLVSAVTTSVEEGRDSTEAVKNLANEMKQERSHREWKTAVDQANAPKKFAGRTAGEWAFIAGLVLAAGGGAVGFEKALKLVLGAP